MIVNQDGTISLKDHRDVVLGMSDNHKEVRWVKKESPCKFIFDNAYEILSMREKYDAEAIRQDQVEKDKKRLKKPWRLSSGVEMRYSQEIGGDNNTTHEIYEWPSNEFLDGLTREQL